MATAYETLIHSCRRVQVSGQHISVVYENRGRLEGLSIYQCQQIARGAETLHSAVPEGRSTNVRYCIWKVYRLQPGLVSFRFAIIISCLLGSRYKEHLLPVIGDRISLSKNEMLEFKDSLAEWKSMPSLLHIEESTSAAGNYV